MIEIGKGGQRSVKTVMMSHYACYLVIQNAEPAKEIVAVGQTCFAFRPGGRNSPMRPRKNNDAFPSAQRLAAHHKHCSVKFTVKKPEFS